MPVPSLKPVEQVAPHSAAVRMGLVAGTVETVGTSLTWTGLPVYVVALTGEVSFLTWLLTVQTIAGLVTTLVAGAVTDRFSLHKTIIATSAVSAAGLITIYVALSPGRVWPFLLLSVVIQIAATIAGNAVRVWFTFLSGPDELVRWTATRGAWLTTAKLVGTGAGPAVYGLTGGGALLLNAALIVAAAVLYGCASRGLPYGVGRTPGANESVGPGGIGPRTQILAQVIAAVRLVRTVPRLGMLLGLQASAGLLGLPLTGVALQLLQAMPSTQTIHYSAFWVVGFGAAFAANLTLSKSRILDRRQVATTGACIAATVVAFAAISGVSDPLVFVLGFVIVVVARTTLNVMLFAAIVPTVPAQYRGRVIALSDLVNNGTGLLALTIFGALRTDALPLTTMAYVATVGIASYILVKAMNRNMRHE
ncbi:MFS transporter [Streptomyces sp. NBC_00289]|uniref:MFS transporter n=1 Tax=Streptomyces sp. NBC_00289 TaxID=2975703 RepID=UPI0032486604